MDEIKCTFEPGLHVVDSKVFVMYETLVRIYHFFRNVHRLMSLVGFPRSPHSGAYAGLGLC